MSGLVGPNGEPVALPVAEERPKVVLPEGVRSRWEALSAEAIRKRTAVSVRLKEGTPIEETAEGDLRGSFLLFVTDRSGVATRLGDAKLFSNAIDQLAAWVEGQAGLGADTLREELKAHARRLAALTPRELSQRRKGQDHRIYLDFRSRILPLAWDNLVEAVKVERLEDFVRKVGELDVAALPPSADVLSGLVAEARALVTPMFVETKEGTDAPDPD